MNKHGVDPAARRRTAELFRHFAAGRLTNWEMEDALDTGYDQGLYLVYMHGVWPVYDDTYAHKLDGKHRLTPAGRRHFARIVLFLRSGLPYRWPDPSGWQFLVNLLLSAATLFCYRPRWRQWQDCGGEEAVWPFFARGEYEAALERPLYLAGARPA